MNGLCVAPGGIFTVARELTSSMATACPDWRFTLLVRKGEPLEREFERIDLRPNTSLLWAPQATSNRAFRVAYENTSLPRWAEMNSVSAALQLNGMVIPALRVPTFSHNGDPWPYRPDLWSASLRHRAVAYLKRREHARAMRRAQFMGWTSRYLHDLVCNYLGFAPENNEVLYNGVPESYLERAKTTLPDWPSRPMEVLTVSNVLPYKRQSLVIQAVAALAKRKGFEDLRYRIVGRCSARYEKVLRRLALDLGISDRIIIEGRVPQARVESCMANARAFAFMSICECFGLPPLEAMTFGTPCVVADCCAAREIYEDAAEFCPPDDGDALVESLAKVMTDGTRAEELRRLGAARAQSFSWTRTADRIAPRLKQLIGFAEPAAAEAV